MNRNIDPNLEAAHENLRCNCKCFFGSDKTFFVHSWFLSHLVTFSGHIFCRKWFWEFSLYREKTNNLLPVGKNQPAVRTVFLLLLLLVFLLLFLLLLFLPSSFFFLLAPFPLAFSSYLLLFPLPLTLSFYNFLLPFSSCLFLLPYPLAFSSCLLFSVSCLLLCSRD